MNDIFYVYLLLDPRKPVLQPFYVGKGKANRYHDHLSPSSSRMGRNKLKNGIIAKIREANLEVRVWKYAEGLSEGDAFNLERKLIARFGRRDTNSGILANLTDGGEGSSGYIYSEAQRHHAATIMKGENNPMYGRRHSNDTKFNISKKKRDGFANGVYFPAVHSNEHKEKMRLFGKQRTNGAAICKMVLQIAQDGKTVIRSYSSTVECCAELGLSDNSNYPSFGWSGCPPRRDGFFYRYADAEDYANGQIQNFEHLLKLRVSLNRKIRNKRSVIQFRDETEISRYETINEAVKQNPDLKYGALWQAIKHERQYKGFLWKYGD